MSGVAQKLRDRWASNAHDPAAKTRHEIQMHEVRPPKRSKSRFGSWEYDQPCQTGGSASQREQAAQAGQQTTRAATQGRTGVDYTSDPAPAV